MTNFFDDFDAEFEEPAKPALQPSKAFDNQEEPDEEDHVELFFDLRPGDDMDKPNVLFQFQKYEQLDNVPEFKPEPSFVHMPQGLKEAQHLNGVRDHGVNPPEVHVPTHREVLDAYEAHLRAIRGHVPFKEFKEVLYPAMLLEKTRGTIIMSSTLEGGKESRFKDIWMEGEIIATPIPHDKRVNITLDEKTTGVFVPAIQNQDDFGFEVEEEKASVPAVGLFADVEPKQDKKAKKQTPKQELPAAPFSQTATEKKPIHINDIVIDKPAQFVPKLESVIPPTGGKAWLGIDPGKDGGMVAIDDNGTIVSKQVIPKLGDNVDALGVWNILQLLHYDYNLTVIIEDVHSLYGMAAATNFSMGHTLGILEGLVTAAQIRLTRVSPKTWQKEIWEKDDMEYKPIKEGQKKPSIETKQTSMKAAHRLFPREDFRKSTRATKDHDGICDSVCLAEYARRKNV